MGFDTVSRTHVGLRRKINEDNLLVRPDLGLFVVADGMGGHEAGEVASGRIVAALDGLSPGPPDTMLSQAEQLLQEVNGGLRELAGAGGVRTIGSTAVGLLAHGDTFRCLWAGDSRAYRLRDRQLQQISRDHSLVQELVDAGMLEADKANDHPQGSVITRAVGASDDLRVDVVEGDLRAGDLFLLASDGVTRVIEDGELAEMLAAPTPLIEIADGLVWTVLRRGAPDNATLILVRVED